MATGRTEVLASADGSAVEFGACGCWGRRKEAGGLAKGEEGGRKEDGLGQRLD